MAWYARAALPARFPRHHAGQAVVALLVGQHVHTDLHRMFLVAGRGDEDVKGRAILRRYARWLRDVPNTGGGGGGGGVVADGTWLTQQLLALGAVTTPAYTAEAALRWMEGVAAFPLHPLRVTDVTYASCGPLAAALHDAVLETVLERRHDATWRAPVQIMDPVVAKKAGLVATGTRAGVPGLFLWAGGRGAPTVTVTPTPVDALSVDARFRNLQATVAHAAGDAAAPLLPLVVAVDQALPSMVVGMLSPLRGVQHWTPHAVALAKRQVTSDAALRRRATDTLRAVLHVLPTSASVDAERDAARLEHTEYLRLRVAEAAALLGLPSILQSGLNVPGEALYRHETGAVHDALVGHPGLHMAGLGVHGAVQYPTQVLPAVVRGVRRVREEVKREEAAEGAEGEEGRKEASETEGVRQPPAPSYAWVELSPKDPRMRARLHGPSCPGNVSAATLCAGACTRCTLYVDSSGSLVDAVATHSALAAGEAAAAAAAHP